MTHLDCGRWALGAVAKGVDTSGGLRCGRVVDSRTGLRFTGVMPPVLLERGGG